MPETPHAIAPQEDHLAIWVSGDGWNLNCSCGWKSEKVGYYQRERAIAALERHIEETVDA